MSVAKVIELMADGETMEAAVQNAVSAASGSLRNVTGVYVNEMKGLVEDGKVTGYRVNCKITFVVDSAE